MTAPLAFPARAAAAAIALATTAPAFAAPAPRTAGADAASIVVEVGETTARGATSSARFDATLVEEERPVSLRAAADGAQYEISLAWRGDRREPRAPLLFIDFKQHRRGRPSIEFQVPARVERGKRTLVGGMTRPDGSRFSLAITLR
jgi:hypothetical protein